MEASLREVFDSARRIVGEHDRRKAEEEQRVRDAEREVILRNFAGQVDSAFDFTSREKVELDPRMDVLEGRGVLEFIVRSYRAIFLLSDGGDGKWGLQAAEDDKPLELLTEVDTGDHSDPNARRLAAARVVSAIADWVDRRGSSQPRPALLAASPETDILPPSLSASGHPGASGNGGYTETPSISDPSPSRRPSVPHFGKTFGY